MSKKLPPPTPMAGKGKPVDWLFVFKFNGSSFPGCAPSGTSPAVGTPGIFGGAVKGYPAGHSQQYVYATSMQPTLQQGSGCVGFTLDDPLGATFGQIYNQPGYYYVVWNDQFYNSPLANRDEPWGHSKGMVAWNDDGEGMVLQVSTPSWPASASSAHPRQGDGNTLGCIDDDDIEVSQHFFALKLSKEDLIAVLKALANASVVTSISQPSIVQNGGPANVQALVNQLSPSNPSTSTTPTKATLSSGVILLSKPGALQVPPWQLVSALMGGIDLRVACWWTKPEIASTTASTQIQCWQPGLGKYGAVQVATSGIWNGVKLGLMGGFGDTFNHAKVAVSLDPSRPLSLFGDMNQQGALWPDYAYSGQLCSSSQNGRGGMFWVLENQDLWKSISALLQGESAPEAPQGPNAATSAAATASGTGKPSPSRKKAAKKAGTKPEKKVVKKAAKKATKKAAKKAKPKPAPKAAKKAVKKPSGKTAGKPVKKAAKKQDKPRKAVKKAVKKAAKKAVKKAQQKSSTKAVKKTSRKPGAAKRVVKKSPKKAAKKAAKKTVKKVAKKAAKKR